MHGRDKMLCRQENDFGEQQENCNLVARFLYDQYFSTLWSKIVIVHKLF